VILEMKNTEPLNFAIKFLCASIDAEAVATLPILKKNTISR
jgi:hypothetical protein